MTTTKIDKSRLQEIVVRIRPNAIMNLLSSASQAQKWANSMLRATCSFYKFPFRVYESIINSEAFCLEMIVDPLTSIIQVEGFTIM